MGTPGNTWNPELRKGERWEGWGEAYANDVRWAAAAAEVAKVGWNPCTDDAIEDDSCKKYWLIIKKELSFPC